ncbi:MAG: hypothetical protein WD342_10605 [Verrucomicrobiales bacterium]
MNSRPTVFPLAAALAAATLLSTPAKAQRPDLSAREAIDLVSSQFGPRSVQWLAEMQARGGVPQPTDWELVSYDDRAPRLLYNFWASNGRAGDGGTDETRYPANVPVGYFSPNQIAVDSVAAFTVAEGEARKAKMAFDSCDYLLRVRDFSTEPIWRLELFDSTERLVGKIYLSATSAEVLRTVWVYRDQRARPEGAPLIIDSFAPTPRMPGAGITGNEYSSRELIPGRGGIASVPMRREDYIPGDPRIRGDAGITGIPSRPAPPTPRMFPADPQPYAPAPTAPSGNADDDSIPEPPPISGDDAPATAAPSSDGRDMRDLRDAPAENKPDSSKPPIDAPDNSGGSSGRIPPPPIPR